MQSGTFQGERGIKMNRAKTIQEILQEQREERDRERLANFLLKLFFAHIAIVTIYFYFSK